MEQKQNWPRALQKGDLIGIAAPARKVKEKELEAARELLHSWGFDTVLASNVGKSWGQLAGTDHARAEGMNGLLREERVKAILTARGGYGSIRMVSNVNWELFQKRPVWFCGFSDVTVLHSKINQMNLPSLHGPVATTLLTSSREAQNSFLNALTNESISLEFPATVVREGQWEGKILGGNLSMLYSLNSTPLFPKLSGETLLIEDLDEMLYHVDRMMMNFEHSGLWKTIGGLLVGGLSEMRDNTPESGFVTDNPFGRETDEILLDAIKNYDFPVVKDLPSGHIKDNRTIVLGASAQFRAEDGLLKVLYV